MPNRCLKTGATSSVRLALAALCLSVVGLPAQTPTDPTAALFAADRILDVDVRLPPADWHDVRTSHRDGSAEDLAALSDDAYEYRRADVRVDGVIVASVGVRKKGFFGSAVSTRPSLKIKFDEYVAGQTFGGLGTITLNNNNQDQTFVQQYLAYDFFARAGVPASRAGFARVRVNGEDLGVYTHVEAVGAPLLRRLFGHANGLLYESYAGDFTAAEIDNIVGKNNASQKDRRRLQELVAALSSPGPVSVGQIEQLVDVDSFIRLWAAEVLVGHWDGYAGNRNNYYLYLHPTSNKFHFLPWGPDSVFADPGPFLPPPVPKSVKARGMLSRRLWELPAVRGRYRAEMKRLLAGAWDEQRMASDTARLQKLLQPHSALSPAIVEAASASVLAFIQTRRAEVDAELVAPGPDWPNVVTTARAASDRRGLTVTGTFNAPWVTTAPLNPFASGAGTLTMAVEGQAPVTFARAGAFALENGEALIPPASIRQKYVAITLAAQSGTKVWQVMLTIDPHQLTRETRRLPVDHFAVWAILVEVDVTAAVGTPPTLRVFGVVGELRFDDIAPGEGGTGIGAMKGTFTLRTREM